MAIASGLTMAICNPDQATLMNAALASDLLLAKDNSDNNYEPIEVDIPLYINGEIRLIMKNAEYSTNLPTVFLDIQNSAPQGSYDVDS